MNGWGRSRWLLLFLVLISILPVQASLKFHGPHLQTEGILRDAYGGFPDRGKQISWDVWILTRDEWQVVQDFFRSPYIYGITFISSTLKHTYLFEEDPGIRATFAHEFAHLIYRLIFSREEKKSWEHFWESEKKQVPDPLSRENAEEGFCDCYASIFAPAGSGTAALSSAARQEITGFFQGVGLSL